MQLAGTIIVEGSNKQEIDIRIRPVFFPYELCRRCSVVQLRDSLSEIVRLPFFRPESDMHDLTTAASAFSLLVLIITASLPAAPQARGPDKAGIAVRRELYVAAPNKQTAESRSQSYVNGTGLKRVDARA